MSTESLLYIFYKASVCIFGMILFHVHLRRTKTNEVMGLISVRMVRAYYAAYF